MPGAGSGLYVTVERPPPLDVFNTTSDDQKNPPNPCAKNRTDLRTDELAGRNAVPPREFALSNPCFRKPTSSEVIIEWGGNARGDKPHLKAVALLCSNRISK